MQKLKRIMSTLVTDYLIHPHSHVDRTPQLEKSLSTGKPIWHAVHFEAQRGWSISDYDNCLLHQNHRQSAYFLQGMSLPLCDGASEKDIDMIVFFIAGSNNHLFTSRQRAIECAYATQKALRAYNPSINVMLSRFNPYGVINNIDAGYQTFPYKPSPLSQQDIVSDYEQCARQILKKYHAAEMVIMGHSLGGVFAKQVYAQLKSDEEYSRRVKLVYSAMSLSGIADAFMYYQPSRMLKNIIPDRLGVLINTINHYGFQCVQRALKQWVEVSGWQTVSSLDMRGVVLHSNLTKDNRDAYIPDAVASVQSESPHDWILTTDKKENAHNMPPSQIYEVKERKKITELEKITAAIRGLFDVETELYT